MEEKCDSLKDMDIPLHKDLLPFALKRINAVRQLKGLVPITEIHGASSRDIHTPCPLAMALGFRAEVDELMCWFDGVEVQTRAQADIFLTAWPDCKIDPLRPYTERFPQKGIYIVTPLELRQTCWVLWHGGFQGISQSADLSPTPDPSETEIPLPASKSSRKSVPKHPPKPLSQISTPPSMENMQLGLFG